MLKFLKRYLLLCGALMHVGLLAMLVMVFHLGPREGLRTLRLEDMSVKWRVIESIMRLEHYRATQLKNELALETTPAVEAHPPFDRLQEAKSSTGRVLSIGPGRQFSKPSQAAAVAANGDIIEIAAGEYRGDTTMWAADNLTIRAVGGIAHINGKGVSLMQEKAIWLIRGNNIRIENIEFSHANSRDLNGAGLRIEADGTQVSHCYFHDNESGILTNAVPDGSLLVEYSEFARNGHPNGQAHQIYVNAMRDFTLRFNYFHGTVAGSAIKSRARNVNIEFNRVLDGATGTSNYAIDLSEGGNGRILGNLIEHGPFSGNGKIISFAPERPGRATDALYVVHNTLINDRYAGTFVSNQGLGQVFLFNNLLIGHGIVARGAALVTGNVAMGRSLADADTARLGGIKGSGGNLSVAEIGVNDRATYDYRLVAGSAAIDAGRVMDAGGGLVPTQEYRHPLSAAQRRQDAAPDAGALEFIAE